MNQNKNDINDISKKIDINGNIDGNDMDIRLDCDNDNYGNILTKSINGLIVNNCVYNSKNQLIQMIIKIIIPFRNYIISIWFILTIRIKTIT